MLVLTWGKIKVQFMKIRRKQAVGGSNEVYQLDNNFHNHINKYLLNLYY